MPPNLTSWGSVGGASLELVADALSDALPNSLRVSSSAGQGNQGNWGPWNNPHQPQGGNGNTTGFFNIGYWGFSVKPQSYTGSFYVKGDYSGDFVASFVSNSTGEILASVSFASESVAGSWTQQNFTLTPTSAAPDSNNTFQITFDAAGASSLDFNLISLFPPTYKSRANGLRPDLMEALHGLNPSFLRFAGGNNLEGNEAPYYWKWNETIGSLLDRPGRPGAWGYENTDGLGLIEYLDWCTDLEIEPILAVWSGLYLDGTIIPQDELQPYIDEALALLEFIMGSSDTPNGALRASLGYGTAPLAQINYVEVGNEDNLSGGSDSYMEYRFPMFYEAISSAYPDMNIIASTVNITLPNDPKTLGDYHVYGKPNDLVLEFADFDQNTSAHRVFLGEYAAIQDNVLNNETAPVDWNASKWLNPRWIGTVAEAIYLIGAERNSEAILGAGWAPTLQNVNSYQWAPDLISFAADPDLTTLSTSYYMVQLMSQNRIVETLPVNAVEGGFGPAYFVAGNTQDGRKMMKFATYNSSVPVEFNIAFDGLSGSAGNGQLTLLTGPEDANEGNVFGSGENVVVRAVSDVPAGSDGTYSFSVPELAVGIFAV